MKLIKIQQHIDGNCFPSNVFLSFGKIIYFNMEPCGWYLRIELPFSSITSYVDANDFSIKTGRCRNAYLIRKIIGIKRISILSANIPI